MRSRESHTGRPGRVSALLALLAGLAAMGAEAQYLCSGSVAGIAGCVNSSSYPAPRLLATNAALCGAVGPAATACTGVSAGCPYCNATNLLRWDSPSTWPSGAVPVADVLSNVSIPAGARVLLSGCMLANGSRFNRIYVPAGSEVGGPAPQPTQTAYLGRVATQSYDPATSRAWMRTQRALTTRPFPRLSRPSAGD